MMDVDGIGTDGATRPIAMNLPIAMLWSTGVWNVFILQPARMVGILADRHVQDGHMRHLTHAHTSTSSSQAY